MTEKAKCDTCNYNVARYLFNSISFARGKSVKRLNVCTKCYNKKNKGWVYISRFKRFIDPEIIEFLVSQHPEGLDVTKLTLAQVTKGIDKHKAELRKKQRVVQVTAKERKTITDKFGKGKFNPSISRKGEQSSTKKTDTWLNWDAYDYKEDDLSTLLL